MSDLNKVLAFFVGLFVIILIVGFAISRAGDKSNNSGVGGSLNRIFKLGSSSKPTKVPKKNISSTNKSDSSSLKGRTITPTPTTIRSQSSLNQTTSIPATGSPILPATIAILFTGIVLLKKNKA